MSSVSFWLGTTSAYDSCQSAFLLVRRRRGKWCRHCTSISGRLWHWQDVSWLLSRCHSSQPTVLKNTAFQLQASKSPLNSSGYFRLWHISPWNCADILPLKSPEGGLCRAQTESGFAKLHGFSLLCRKKSVWKSQALPGGLGPECAGDDVCAHSVLLCLLAFYHF